MNNVMSILLSDYARNCDRLRLEIARIDAGDRTGVRYWPQREAYDDTGESHQTLRENLAEYEGLITRYSPAA